MIYQFDCRSRSAVHGETLLIQWSPPTASPVQITTMNFVLQVEVNEDRKDEEGGRYSDGNRQSDD